MFVPFWLTLLWLLGALLRTAGGGLCEAWGRLWWLLVLGGTLVLMPSMLLADLSKAAGLLAHRDLALLAPACLAVVLCWCGVAAHVAQLDRLRPRGAGGRTVDLVMDICLYPVILSLLAAHSALVLLTREDSLEASTTLAAGGIFESWALASVLTLFQCYARIGSGISLGVYQFLLLNAGVNVAAFYVKGVAPCALCYRLGHVSCAALAQRVEGVRLSELVHVPPGLESMVSAVRSLGVSGALPEPPLLDLLLGLSGTLAMCVVVSFEVQHSGRLHGFGQEAKVPMLPWRLRGSLVKLLGVKLIVGVIWVQPHALALLSAALAHRGLRRLDVEFWNAWLLSLEALLLHAFHASLAYPISDFRRGGALAEGASPAGYGAAGEGGGPGPGGGGPDPGPAREAPGLTWVEKLTIALLGGLALLSWASLASLLDMGSCRPGLLHGSAAFGGGAIHACDVATVTCDPGFALALDGAAAVQATCAKDQQFFAQGGGALAECGLCAPGHVGYPACARCDSSVHCHGHAASVTDDGRRAACLCSCAGQWGGKDCSECAPGHVGYPACSACTSQANCNGHAVNVTDDGRREGCRCTCGGAFGGADCGACAPGHVGYPACEQCTSERHCHGHAASVTDDGSRSGCRCACGSAFGGADCGACADGHVGYPDCQRCTTTQHCSGHAVAVAADELRERCECTCGERWSGERCDRCAPGHVNYPECEACSIEKHCHAHATRVTDDGTGSRCVCECDDKWGGGGCDLVATDGKCTCQAEWKHCWMLGVSCETLRGCSADSKWLGRPWCETTEGCEHSWDYC